MYGGSSSGSAYRKRISSRIKTILTGLGSPATRAPRPDSPDSRPVRPGCVRPPAGGAVAVLMRGPRGVVSATSDVVWCSSSGPPEGLTEQAGGTEQQDDDEQQEGDDVLPLRADQGGPVVFGQAEHEAAEQRAAHVADAAQDGGGERLHAEDEPGVPAGDAELHQVEQRRATSHDPAEQEGDLDDAVLVDTHQRGGLGVLRHGPDTQDQTR